MNVGKMQIKGEGVTMATSHGSPPPGHLPLAPGTLISQWRIENTKELTLNLNLGVSKNQEAGGRGRTKGKKQQGNSKQATRAKTTWEWLECACATRSPADNRESPS